jgi:hypothetical protein
MAPNIFAHALGFANRMYSVSSMKASCIWRTRSFRTIQQRTRACGEFHRSLSLHPRLSTLATIIIIGVDIHYCKDIIIITNSIIIINIKHIFIIPIFDK